MFLRVNPKDTFWGYGDIWVTSMDKYPLEIDLNSIDSDVKNKIMHAIHAGILFEVDQDDNRLQTSASSVQVPIKTQTNHFMFEKKMTEILGTSVNVLRKEIAKVKHLPSLEFAFEHEKNTKNRKTVLNIIREQMRKLGSDKNHNIYDYMITEEKVGEVVLNVNSMTIVDEKPEIVVVPAES